MQLTPALVQAGVTRGIPDRAPRILPTGFADLDACLPNHGWPQGALVTLQPAVSGIGELQLLMPALARLSQEARYLVWVAPPHRLSAPMLVAHRIALERVLTVRPQTHKEALWSAYQALSSVSVGAVMCWFSAIRHSEFRALARAAAQGGQLGFCFLPPVMSAQVARLRLVLRPVPQGLRIDVDGQSRHAPVVIADIHRKASVLCRAGAWRRGSPEARPSVVVGPLRPEGDVRIFP